MRITKSNVIAILATGWRITGMPDLDGDGNADVLLHNATTRELAMWRMAGDVVLSAATLGTLSSTNWKVVGTGDFNGDGTDDIVLRNLANNDMDLWEMNGAAVLASGVFARITYGEVPEGFRQMTPEQGSPPHLERGARYVVHVSGDDFETLHFQF